MPRLPLRPPDDYLRDAMAKTLAGAGRRVRHHAAAADRPAPDADRERRGLLADRGSRRACRPRVLRIPRQTFDSPEQLAFARILTYNPWHCLPEHRPLGNQSRARQRMYWELSGCARQMNAVEHYEPTGDETFRGLAEPSAAR